MTDAEQIDALAYHLMDALDRNDVLRAENKKLRRLLALADFEVDFAEWQARP
jgi:regulator of replication initiation timing